MEFSIDEIRQYRYQSQNKEFVQYINGNVKEAYVIFREYNDNINLYRANYFNWDLDFSCCESYNISGSFQLNTISDVDTITNCKELITEYKQNKEYEDKISKLSKELEQITKHRNSLWSKDIWKSAPSDDNTYIRTVCDADKEQLFAIWVDDYSPYYKNGKLPVLYCPLPDDFIKSDYFKELFLPNEFKYFDSEAFKDCIKYNPPSTAIYSDGREMGHNYQFFIVNNKALPLVAPSLKFYYDEVITLGLCTDITYMYNRLNGIWLYYFNKEHNEGND